MGFTANYEYTDKQDSYGTAPPYRTEKKFINTESINEARKEAKRYVDLYNRSHTRVFVRLSHFDEIDKWEDE